MRPDERPPLSKACKLVGAGGTTINELGKGEFSIQLGNMHMQIEAVVAEIDDDGLLGVDALQSSSNGPADIMMSKGVLVIDKQEVPIIQVGLNTRVRRVTAADHFVIPAQSKAIIDVFIERKDHDDFSAETDYIIEPTAHFRETYPLQMAPSLTNINNACTSKVRLLNPFPTAVSIKQDAVVGQAEPIDGLPKLVVKQENANEADNYTRIRRLQFCKQGSSQADHKVEDKVRYVKESEGVDVPEHLRDLYQRATRGLDAAGKQKVADLLSRFQDTFSKGEWDIGLTDLTEHEIPTGDAKPVKQPPRRVPLAHAADEKKAIDDLKAKGVIRESVSPWASPIVLVSKKDGGVRPCVDYRKVNELVKPEAFPLPRVQDCLDAVAGSNLFSTFDLTSGYFQIKVKESVIPKTAFVCKYGHFEMTRMPFGLSNSASTFQRTMELCLQTLQWETCLIYIDDIIVFGKDLDQHMQRVEEVLTRLRDAGLKLKADKSHLLQEEVVFLGHVVSGAGVKPNPTNIAKIVDWPKPKTAKQIRQLVAMGSYYRRYIKGFASMVRPMVDLTKKGRRFVWDAACDEAFTKLKKSLVSADVMGYPLNEGGDFILDVDASDVGIGGVLHQVQQGKEKVIAYASRALNRAETNYCITEKELLAARYFIEYFRQYLLGRRFIVRSDHQSLVWLFKLKEPRGKIARWIEVLSQYNFEIQYRPGKSQGHCDSLSRCENPRACDCPMQDTMEPLKCGPCKKCLKRAQDMLHEQFYQELVAKDSEIPQPGKEAEVVKTLESVEEADEAGPSTPTRDEAPEREHREYQSIVSWFQGRSASELAKLQAEDPDIGPVLQGKLANTKPSSQDMAVRSPAARHYWILWDSLVLQDGLLCKKYSRKDGTGQYLQFVVPSGMKKEVLYQMHDSMVSGHMGTKKTKEKILQRFYWYALKEDVGLYVQRCDTCAADKKPQKIPRAPMGSLQVGAPGDCIATDYIGPLPVTERGNRYILVFTDHFSKNVEVIPVCDMTAEVCADKLLNEIISRWGCPLSIHSDQGRTYESRVFRELCRMLEVRKTRTSVRNPRGNGQVERFNRTLLRMIRAYLCGEQREWDLHLGCIAGAYRATPNEATRMTPNLLTMGREVRLPGELVFGSTNTYDGEEITTYGEYVDVVRARMQHAHEVARKHMSSAAKRSKDLYDTKVAFNRYNVGDVVWYLMEVKKLGVAPKLEYCFEGPYVIKRKISELDFVLQVDRAGTEKPVHHNKLKPYEGKNLPKWVKRAKKAILQSKQ